MPSLYETRFVEVTIAITNPLSTRFSFQGQRVVGVIVPSAWTAADITFEIERPLYAADNPGTTQSWIKVVNRAGALYKLTGVATATSEYQMVAGDANQGDVIITGPGDGRIVSTNTGSEADVNQGAARTVIVVLADR